MRTGWAVSVAVMIAIAPGAPVLAAPGPPVLAAPGPPVLAAPGPGTLAAPAAATASMCGPSPVIEAVPAAIKGGPVRVSAMTTGTPTITIKRTNRAGDVEIVFQSVVPLPAGPLLFDVSRFRDGSQRLDPGAVTVTVDRRNDKEVWVDVCVDRNVTKARPGAYTGSVIIRDARLSGPDVPLILTIQDSRLGWIGGLGILGMAALAVVGIWVSVRRAAGQPTFGKDALAALRAWSTVNLVFTSIVAVGAAWTVLQTQGFSDDAFAGDLESYVHLFLVMFGAAYTTGSIPPVIAGQGNRGDAAKAATQPAVDEPAFGEPRADEPAVDEPRVDEPGVGEPAAVQPKAPNEAAKIPAKG